MDWSVIIAVCAVGITAVMAWKMWRLKKNVYDFADALEWNLDAVIAGREPEETGETEDSLLGRVNEKLHRVNHILEQKEQETARNREQMKELISDISHQTKTPDCKPEDLSGDFKGAASSGGCGRICPEAGASDR